MTDTICSQCAYSEMIHDKNIIGCNWYWSADLPQGVAAEIAIVQADELEAA